MINRIRIMRDDRFPEDHHSGDVWDVHPGDKKHFDREEMFSGEGEQTQSVETIAPSEASLLLGHTALKNTEMANTDIAPKRDREALRRPIAGDQYLGR
ncbi:MAG TPA: hypothetical protein PK543_03700 [Candidatus Saccharibacteria bacterium]|nr:hypothetical protein [Candidatus Saccharibacteria bacterium]